MFDNKLYKHFYPLETEEDKMFFLNTNFTKILRTIEDIVRMTIAEISDIRYDYMSKMKPAFSFWGTPKYKNIAHNENIVIQMESDKRFAFISEELLKLEPLVSKLVNDEKEKISVEELNHILKVANTMWHKKLRTIMISNIGIILILVYWLLVG